MWVFLNDSFLSIVRPTATDLRHFDVRTPDVLSVRARKRKDLEILFPKAKIYHSKHRDYAWRAFIPRDKVAEVVAGEIEGIFYDNFKDSVAEKERKQSYMRVWSAMADFQNGPYKPFYHENQRALL